jgi:transcriptional regulator with XRE-family HTH domain
MANGDRPASRVREARQAKDLLLTEAAQRCEVSIGYLSMIENGYIPKSDIRKRIAKALGCKVSALWPELQK